MDFINFYNSLPTRADQKEIRHQVISRCKIKKSTFYTWLERDNIPDPKALAIITEIMEDYQLQLCNQTLDTIGIINHK
jgi:hypothetical protein